MAEVKVKKAKINVEFKTAEKSEPLKSGDSINTHLGKIDRFMQDTQISPQEDNQLAQKEDGWYVKSGVSQEDLDYVKDNLVQEYAATANSGTVIHLFDVKITNNANTSFRISFTQLYTGYRWSGVLVVSLWNNSGIYWENTSATVKVKENVRDRLDRTVRVIKTDTHYKFYLFGTSNYSSSNQRIRYVFIDNFFKLPSATLSIYNETVDLSTFEDTSIEIPYGYTQNPNIAQKAALDEATARIESMDGDISDLKSYIGYTDQDVLGLYADFENNIFTRLAGAINLTPGADFDKFNAFGGRKRCIVGDDGTILGWRRGADASKGKEYELTDAGLAYFRIGQDIHDPESTCISLELAERGFATTGPSGMDACQVMVYQPEFYYKVVPIKLDPIDGGKHGYAVRKANYYVSDTPKAGFNLHPAFIYDEEELDCIFFSAYEGCVYDAASQTYDINDAHVADFTPGAGDKLSSIADAKPCSGTNQALTRPNARQLAHNRGEGWELCYAATVSASQMLMLIEYATFDMQSAIGKGVVDKSQGSVNNAEKTGATSSLGNKSGMADGTNGLASISYRGEENVWSNIYSFVDGTNLRNPDVFGSGDYGRLYVADHDFADDVGELPYGDTGICPDYGNGYISAFGYSKKYDWLFVPVEIKGDSSLPVGDYRWNRNAGWRVALISGQWYQTTSPGAFCWVFNDDSSYTSKGCGARLVYIPKAKKEAAV